MFHKIALRKEQKKNKTKTKTNTKTKQKQKQRNIQHPPERKAKGQRDREIIYKESMQQNGPGRTSTGIVDA